MRSATLVALALLTVGCAGEPPEVAAIPEDPACFGNRVLSYQDLSAEVVIPTGESCANGSFQLVFTRGADTLATLQETRVGTVGFIGTSDVNGDGRGEFFVATFSTDSSASGMLYAYTDGTSGIERFPLAALDSAQLAGYAGRDRFGFGGGDQLVRAFPLGAAGDTAWFGYSHGESKWTSITRPSWVR
jgi:hypothetical protein